MCSRRPDTVRNIYVIVAITTTTVRSAYGGVHRRSLRRSNFTTRRRQSESTTIEVAQWLVFSSNFKWQGSSQRVDVQRIVKYVTTARLLPPPPSPTPPPSCKAFNCNPKNSSFQRRTGLRSVCKHVASHCKKIIHRGAAAPRFADFGRTRASRRPDSPEWKVAPKRNLDLVLYYRLQKKCYFANVR